MYQPIIIVLRAAASVPVLEQTRFLGGLNFQSHIKLSEGSKI
jgi:hypothetical protein